jgi:serine/threonine-protein kinase HipA
LAEFEYSPYFIGKGLEPSPLMMPVREVRVYSFENLNRATFSGLPGLLADSPPANAYLITTRSMRRGMEARIS